ncbi:cation diffusion facilitator family transporter [Dyadobacter sandarakinus]|uniref:Cation transporter n=1 Tax=Dyadobacter sandarakinus TaxID=2747268 RepID=A0ABX7I5N8_9BACT|nr:cation diffusion facilitator family transporter [Dyadobacter sandarakinus]QRR01414.1 cation transporter [Dyadobacter sandarakinus]
MSSSKTSIYSALGANLLISVTKFVAGSFSNSASMISEGIHSLVDTVNQLLLLLGISRSHKEPDATHPFGYGKELYFWSFIVSILIFGLGGGLSVYQGIIHIIRPEALGNPKLSYIVLVLSILFEGTSLVIAAKEFNHVKGDLGWWEAIVKSKDPSTFLVLFEDLAAVIGLVIVGVCLYLGHLLNMPVLDGVASLLVGILLIIVSIILARESRSLLMGEGVARETKVKIKALVDEVNGVVSVPEILSNYLSPNEIVMIVMVVFRDDMTSAEINAAIHEIRSKIKEKSALVKFVFVQPTDHLYLNSFFPGRSSSRSDRPV